jgi:ABC-type uncharacterized transport system permease subunit
MHPLPAVYQAKIRLGLAVYTQYRVNAFLALIYMIFDPVIALAVWTTVARSGGVAGYTARDFAAYYLIFIVVRQFVESSGLSEWEQRIRDGFLSTLVRHCG